MRGESDMDKLVYGEKIDWYCFPPMDPVTGEVSVKDDALLASDLRHCDLPARHRRIDCSQPMDKHYWISNGTREGVVLCPMGLFIPVEDYN